MVCYREEFMENKVLTVKGMLSQSNILYLIKEQEKLDQKSFKDNSNIFYSKTLTTKYSNLIFSENKVSSIIESEANSIDSFFVYYIPQKDWESIIYKKYPDTLLKLKSKMFELQSQKEFLENKFDKNKQHKSLKILSCPDCKSKININAYLKKAGWSPNNCPVCGSDCDSKFNELWVNKQYGSLFLYKKQRILEKIRKISEEITKNEKKQLQEISDTSPKIKNAKNFIRTLIVMKIEKDNVNENPLLEFMTKNNKYLKND